MIKQLDTNIPYRTLINEGVPRSEMNVESTIGLIRKDPIVLYGIFVELTQQMYGSEITDTPWKWSKDEKKTRVWIDTEARWEDVNPEFRPAIYISINDVKYKPMMGNRSKIGMNLKEAEYHHARDCSGVVSWVHIGSSKGEGVQLLQSTLEYLDVFSDVIKNEFCFDSFLVAGYNPIQVTKESKERIRSILSATVTWQETWSLKLESPKLKAITFNAGQAILDILHL